MTEESNTLSTMEQVQKLQEFIGSADIANLQTMSQSEKLQYILSSKEFMANMASSLLMNKSMLQPMDETDTNTQNLPKNSLSHQEQMEIQKKLSLYDNTLKETLEAIKSGKFKSDQFLQSQFQSLPSDNEMNQLLKDIKLDKMKKLKVGNEISVSLEKEDNIDDITTDSSSIRTADEYIEQMIKIINQNKKFDNFLEEVSKIENLSKINDNSNIQVNRMSDINVLLNNNDNNDNNDNENDDTNTCELTFEYNKNGELINTGADDVFKKKINSQIIKALESFKLDDNLEEDIANAIAKSFENGQNPFSHMDDAKIELLADETDGEQKNFLLDSFTNQLKQYKMHYLEQLKEQNINLNQNLQQHKHQLQLQKQLQNHLQQQKRELIQRHHDMHEKNQQLHQHQDYDEGQDQDHDRYKYHSDRNHQGKSNLTQNRNNYKTSSRKNPKMDYAYSNPTPEQRLKLQRECMERLRLQDFQMAEESASKGKKKKKNKKKKNSTGISNTSNKVQNDSWLCELCEYKIVYGEIPIFLNEWLQKKVHAHEKMENYQRYLLRQRQERKRQQNSSHNKAHSGCEQNHDHCQHYTDEDDLNDEILNDRNDNNEYDYVEAEGDDDGVDTGAGTDDDDRYGNSSNIENENDINNA